MVIKLLKLLYDWQVRLPNFGMLFHWGPAGQLQVSHAHQLSEHATTFEPLYAHNVRIPLTKGEV